MVKSGDTCGSESALSKGCAVRCSAERRNHALLALDSKLVSCLHKEVGSVCVSLDGTVEVTVVYHEELRVMNCIVRENEGGNIVELVLVSLAPCLCTSESGLLRTCENNAKLGIFKLNALVLESLEKSNAHVAAAEVVVSAVNNSSVVDHKVKTDKERNKDKAYKTCLAKRC